MATRGDAILTPSDRAAAVKERAAQLGFQRCGITDLSPLPHGDALRAWLAAGMAGNMGYMPRQAKRRLDPGSIWNEAVRAVMLTRAYDSTDSAVPEGHGRVARYARGRDYHTALRIPLQQLAVFIENLGAKGQVSTRTYLDAGPVPERELSQRAGLGWIGKNTMLIDPQHGSYCFIGSVFTNLDIAVDEPFEADRCGTCTKCLDACPTAAFAAPRVLDSRACISYLTIEYRGPFRPDAPSLENWIFGCDVCQEVCPWNQKFATPVKDEVLGHRMELASFPRDGFDAMDQEQFAAEFGGTAFSRTGLAGMKRNAGAAQRDRTQPPDR